MAISQGLGRILEKDDPVLATIVDPFNIDARVRRIAQEVGREQSPELPANVDDDVRAAIVYNPIDARLFSILGEIRQRQGDTETAHVEFRKAQSLSRTELMSVQNLIGWSLQRGQIGDAVADIDTLLRRWPNRFETVAPFFLQILGSESGYDATLASLADGAPWRGGLVRYLSGQPEGVSLAEELLADLSSTDKPATPVELSTVINGRLRIGQYEQAYRSFLFSLSPAERAYEGYVYNSHFAPLSLLRPFDWEYRSQRGVELTVPNKDEPESGVRIRFLNAPVRETGMAQMVMLPPGDYTLTVEASAKNLSLPKQLRWVIYCWPKGRWISVLDIPEGSFQRRKLDLRITIPDNECEMQRLQLMSGLVTESWRYRYQGELVVYSVRMEKVGA